MKQRTELSRIENDGYAKLVAHGFDTFVEVYKCKIPMELKERLTKARNEACDRDAGKAEGLTIDFGETEFQIHPYRAKGVEFILKNDLFTIDFMYTEWNIKATFHPPVLWGYGIEKAREMLFDILFKEVQADGVDFARVSIAHYAFDFYAPKFDSEMKPEIMNYFLCSSRIKKRLTGKIAPGAEQNNKDGFQFDFFQFDFWMNGARGETATIGTKKSLQLQIYDKTTEIREFSGKYWMYDLWRQSGLEIDDSEPPRIWRVEIRFGKEHLKNRDANDMRRFECFIPCVYELCCDALENRRLIRPNLKDKNKSRWPMHPLWSAIFDACGNPPESVPLGKMVEKTSDEMENMFLLNIAGDLRSCGVLKNGTYNRKHAEEFISKILDQVEADPDHDVKMERARERYKYINSAK